MALSFAVVFAVVFALGAPRAHAAAASTPSSSWNVVHGDVRVTCPMTIGGSFEARTGAIHGTLTLAATAATLGGDLSVDLGALDTGIGLRDEHLRRNYLELDRGPGFDRAVLSEIHLGDGDPRGVQGKTHFSGTFLLHGTKRPVAGSASVRQEGGSVRVEASFPVTVSEFGIAKPQYLGVGVKDEVKVTVSFVAQPSDGPEGTR